MGLPAETEKDVILTNELIDKLHGFKSLIVPLFFVATGELKDESKSFDAKTMSRAHNELFLNCWEHNLKWGDALFQDWDSRSIKGLVRPFLKLAYNFSSIEVKEVIRICRENYDADIGKIVTAHHEGSLKMEPITARALFTMVKNYSLDDDDEKVSAVSGEKGSSGEQ